MCRSNPCDALVRVEATCQPLNMNVAKGVKRGVNALVHIDVLRDNHCLNTVALARLLLTVTQVRGGPWTRSLLPFQL